MSSKVQTDSCLRLIDHNLPAALLLDSIVRGHLSDCHWCFVALLYLIMSKLVSLHQSAGFLFDGDLRVAH